ncbi:hypothetical protein [Deminuibacter soli]|uniref:Uncharacterized protein n=1 Tax=Deminuibacter soli TaxID=2291815 RepID=A0A3E1NQ68_9BACT|nr:hypothetical protein [Deminuibacter soli]RFM30072.1 hypothetical protein DXN05_03610 [Deminuibacter soli]
MSEIRLSIWNQRMLELMEYVIARDRAGSQQEFLEALGFGHTNLRQIKIGKQSFRHEHCWSACHLYGVNMNWLYGFEKEMFRNPETLNAVQKLKLIVEEIAAELDDRKASVTKKLTKKTAKKANTSTSKK